VLAEVLALPDVSVPVTAAGSEAVVVGLLVLLGEPTSSVLEGLSWEHAPWKMPTRTAASDSE